MNILVTGGTGLVGSHLLYKLIKKNNVFALRRNNSSVKITEKIFQNYEKDNGENFSKINWVKGDLLDYHEIDEAVKGMDYVFHTAAMISFKPSDKEKMLYTNIQGTANVVNASLNNNVKKLCHVSSISALGNSINGEIITEETERSKNNKLSDYSKSKFLSENEVWRGIAEGLDAVIVNPSVILGAGNWEQSSSRLFKTINDGLKFYTKGGTGFVDVDDVVDIMIKLVESEFVNERFILNSENLTYKTFFELISQSLNKKKPSIQASNFMLHTLKNYDKIRYVFTGKEPRITKFTLKSAQKMTLYSNEKIKKAINYEFKPITKSIKDISERFLSDLKTNL